MTRSAARRVPTTAWCTMALVSGWSSFRRRAVTGYSGFSAFGSSDSSIYRTRRGFERTLFQFTIVLAVCWVLVSIGTALTF